MASGYNGVDWAQLPLSAVASGTLSATVTAASGRLGALVTIPRISPATGPANQFPAHVMFLLPSTAANSVWYTDDGVTPTTSLGIELIPGSSHLYTFAESIMNAVANTNYQFIASANTNMIVKFWN